MLVEKPERKPEWTQVKDSRSSIPKGVFLQDTQKGLQKSQTQLPYLRIKTVTSLDTGPLTQWMFPRFNTFPGSHPD